MNALLGNWDVLTAKSVSFEDATDEIRAWLSTISLKDLLRRDTWRRLSFFVRVRPEDDLLPVRTVYNGETKNIGLNYLTSHQSMWIAGPDLIVAIVLGKKVHTHCPVRQAIDRLATVTLYQCPRRSFVPLGPTANQRT